MSRIRSIHPGFFTDDDVMELSIPARLLFIGLWCDADDQGVFAWKLKSMKARLLPSDDVDMAALLAELVAVGKVKRFEVDGQVFGAIHNFRIWQRPRYVQAIHPLPDDIAEWVGERRDGDQKDSSATKKVTKPQPTAANDGVKPSTKRRDSTKPEAKPAGKQLNGVHQPPLKPPQNGDPPFSEELNPLESSATATTAQPFSEISPQMERRGEEKQEGREAEKKEEITLQQRQPVFRGRDPADPPQAAAAAKDFSDFEGQEGRLRQELAEILGDQVIDAWQRVAVDLGNLLQDGADLEADILPAIADARAVRGERFQPRSLAYCRNLVMDWRAKRTGYEAPIPAARAPAKAGGLPQQLKPTRTDDPRYSDAGWEGLAGCWTKDGRWEADKDGPPPDDPATFVPAKVIAKLGIAQRSKPVVDAPSALIGRR